jgi:hypothetical protein
MKAPELPSGEYDSLYHITAAELRSLGYPIPVNIPDVAYVTRGSIKLVETIVCCPDKNANEMTADLQFEFTESFRWIKTEFIFKKVTP